LGFEANAIINAMAARKPIVHQSGIEISISISISPNDTKFPSSVLKSIHSRLCFCHSNAIGKVIESRIAEGREHFGVIMPNVYKATLSP